MQIFYTRGNHVRKWNEYPQNRSTFELEMHIGLQYDPPLSIYYSSRQKTKKLFHGDRKVSNWNNGKDLEIGTNMELTRTLHNPHWQLSSAEN